MRTVYFACHLPRADADALNAESGRIYSQVLVEQYRIYRKKGIWLSTNAQERYNDYLNADQPRLLHAHSIDAAQQGFPKACKTAKANREAGAHYPYKRKRYRTTVWKNTGIRLKGPRGKGRTGITDAHAVLRLSRAAGLPPVEVALPPSLAGLAESAFVEARLVYNPASRHYEWHLVLDEATPVPPPPGQGVAAADLGEVHPVALTDGQEACVMSCRELRAVTQHTHKQLADFQQAQAKHQKGSRRWKKLQRRKARFLAKQERRRRDLEHKVSRAAVDWAVEQHIGTLAIGNVREVGNGKRLHPTAQQKVSSWSHGRVRTYLTYKACAAGIIVIDDVDEAYTSQTCVVCGHRHKPRGRRYVCPVCGSRVHRDVQGAANILSRFQFDELAHVPAPPPKYRHPAWRGKRSSGGHPAHCSKA